MTLRRLNFYNLALPEDIRANATLTYSSALGWSWVSVFSNASPQGSVAGCTSGGGTTIPGSSYDTIDKFPFSTDGNATDVGNLTVSRNEVAGQSSFTSGYTSGGFAPPASTVIDKFPFVSDGNASDVGDLTQSRYGLAGQSSTTHGYSSGGYVSPTVRNIIDKFPFAADANATDVGDLTVARQAVGGQNSTSFGYTSGGNTPVFVNTIDRFPFASNANATDVGDLSVIRSGLAGHSSTVSGYNSGGSPSSPSLTSTNIIDKFPFATNANATDVGDLSQSRSYPASQSSTASGYTSGGYLWPTFYYLTIDKFPFASNGNASDVGDLTQSRRGLAGQQY